MRWDLFCRVVDNYGDVGVCWRLARDLAARGETVRLWLDDCSALAWMAPAGALGVEVRPWTPDAVWPEPNEVVVEAFGCDPPAEFVAAMARRLPAPVWINLEYLSAEDYVERCHGLPSPVLAGPGAGLTKWFYYPGFTTATGGLIRECGLDSAQADFDAPAWLAGQGIAAPTGERLVSLFCYDSPALERLPLALAGQPSLLLLTPGAATQLLSVPMPAGVRVLALPRLTQVDFDRLLWSCDLNFVRGEDSFVRAQWAGRPFVWQIYPQADGVHARKLGAFLRLFDATPGLRRLWQAWNGLIESQLELPPAPAWQAACGDWRARLVEQPDLATRLMRFARSRAHPGC